MQKVEVKELKLYESMSQETSCFEAVIYVDDVALIHAQNDGHGGSNSYYWVYPDQSVGSPYNYVEKIDSFLSSKFQPLVLHKGTENEFVLPYDLEQFIETNISLQEQKKDFNRIMKNISIIMDNDVYKLNIPAEQYSSRKEAVQKKFPDAIILNGLPKEEAFKLFLNFAKVALPEKVTKEKIEPKL